MIQNRARSKRNRSLGLSVVIALCGCLVGTVGCSNEQSDEQPSVIRPAKLVEVRASRQVKSVRFPAVIEATKSAEVTFQVGGLLKELPVRAGQRVARGALIGRLDQQSLLNERTTAEAQFEQAESAFLRTERLYGQDAASRREFEQARASRDVARAALDTARKRVDDATLRSPFDGVIAAVHAKRFQNVAAQEPIVTVQTTGAAEAAVRVPSGLVATSGRFETEETVVMLDAAPETRVPAVFQSSTTQADAETQTFLVKFAFTPPEGLVVLPGMTGTVESRMRRLNEGGPADLPAVPLGAILSDGDARYVWLVDTASMTVSRREVAVAPGIGDTLAVMDGLEEGDVIVGAGASYLHEGMQIRPYEN